MKNLLDTNHLKVWISISGLGKLWSNEAKKLSDACKNFSITFIFGFIISTVTKLDLSSLFNDYLLIIIYIELYLSLTFIIFDFLHFFFPFIFALFIKCDYEKKRKYFLSTRDKSDLIEKGYLNYDREKDYTEKITNETRDLYFYTIIQQSFFLSKVFISIIIFLLFILFMFIITKIYYFCAPFLIPIIIFFSLRHLRNKHDNI